jgi:hypothetical protein
MLIEVIESIPLTSLRIREMAKKKKQSKPNEMASKGGKARAEKLSAARKREIALMGVEARREKAKGPLPKATHEGVLMIGDAEIACANLDNGLRVLTQSSFMLALGRARQAKGRDHYDGDVNMPAFLTAKNLKPYIPHDLAVTSSQVEFHTLGGKLAFGYSADLLPKVCYVFMDANDEGKLTHNQHHIAAQAKLLIRGFAHIGITALIDEATGYQLERPRRELEEQLEKFLSESLRKWVRTFPADYFKHLCRLRGVAFRDDMKLPQYFGTLTNNLVYRRIAPGLLKRLKQRREEMGKPNEKLHSGLSLDMGVPEVLLHLGTVVGLMKLHDDYDEFEKQLSQIAHIYPETPGLFDDPKDWEA